MSCTMHLLSLTTISFSKIISLLLSIPPELTTKQYQHLGMFYELHNDNSTYLSRHLPNNGQF